MSECVLVCELVREAAKNFFSGPALTPNVSQCYTVCVCRETGLESESMKIDKKTIFNMKGVKHDDPEKDLSIYQTYIRSIKRERKREKRERSYEEKVKPFQ